MKAKKLTITVSPEVYRGLKRKIGAGKISGFIDGLARPYVVDNALDAAYREMASDGLRESEANEWVDGLADETLKDSD